ncbi:MAG: GNAT family N-acetyltransferase [Hyphomonas sp.]|nr:GNAT family N-acetyltransferase [Hyphomonas sp.]
MTLAPRLLAETDAPAAAALHAKGFADGWSAASIATLIAEPSVFALGIDDAGTLIAFVLFQSAAGDTELLTIATDPVRRGEGHARRLIEAALAPLAAAGNSRLLLDVAEDNAPARHLYARLGFTLDGRRKGYYTAGRAAPVDALLMSRPLGG